MTAPAPPATARALSEWILELRARRQMTRDRLAARAGVSSATIARLEGKAATRHQPQPESLAAVLHALGVGVDEAVTRLNDLQAPDLADAVALHYDIMRPVKRSVFDVLLTLDDGQMVGIEIKAFGEGGPLASTRVQGEIAQALREARPDWKLLVDYDVSRSDALEAHRQVLEAADQLARQRSETREPSTRGQGRRHREGG